MRGKMTRGGDGNGNKILPLERRRRRRRRRVRARACGAEEHGVNCFYFIFLKRGRFLFSVRGKLMNPPGITCSSAGEKRGKKEVRIPGGI
jgi:hypothetical protein